jgi:hypothetical protein
MQRKKLVALAALLLGSAAPATAFAAPLPTCSQLATNAAYGLAGSLVITQTATDNQGLVSPSASIVPATSANSAYCLVHIQYSSGSGPAYGYASGESQTIGINITLPLNSTDGGTPANPTGYTWAAVNGAWNGKVENSGGGGLQGSLNPGNLTLTQATNAGYVGSVTDAGHSSAQNGTLGNYAVVNGQLDVGKLDDFSYESVHQQYLWALALAQSYYGQPATRNYWWGCSTGGRQGMALAQLYGQDFDGFVIGSPVIYWDRLDMGKALNNLVNRDFVMGAGHPAITTAQFKNVQSHAVAACQGPDIGVVNNPFACTYTAETDPTVLLPPAGTCTGLNCLDPVQAQGIDKMWKDAALDGATRNHFGRKMWWGYSPSDSDPDSGVNPVMTVASNEPAKVYAYDHRNLNANVQNLYLSRGLAAANPLGMSSPIAVEDEDQLNQSPSAANSTTNGSTIATGSIFQDNYYQGVIDQVHNGPKRGKILLWSSVDDQVWMEMPFSFYYATATLFGNGQADEAGMSSWFRYYYEPGVGHCGANTTGASVLLATAPDGNYQIFDDLVNWAENGVVPQSAGDYTHEGILATGPGSFGSRPLCPWPTTYTYNGTGPTNVASSYHCGGNMETTAFLCNLLVTPFGSATSNQLNYQELGISPSQCPFPVTAPTHDFNQDGTSDVLWRDTSGNVGMWQMNGTSIAKSVVFGNVPTNWSIAGQRDFGSGNADILWRDTSGNVAIWVMNGTNIVSTAMIGNVPTSWTIVGTGDYFNNDGSGYILWQDNLGNLTIWSMNGTTISKVANIGNVPINWSVVGTGGADIFWRNTTTGDVAMWVMQGATVGQSVDFGTVPLNWSIVGVGDFDGNGSTDLLWRDTSGNVGIWLMNGTTIMSTAVLANVPAAWSVAETGDFNADGKSDVLWTDTSGNVGVWLMNGTTISSSSIYGNVGAAWSAQALNAN